MNLLNNDFLTGFLSGVITAGLLVLVFVLMKRLKIKKNADVAQFK